MNNILKIFIFVIVFSLLPCINIYSENKDKADETVILDEKFFQELQNTGPLKRDQYLDRILNRIVQCRGYVDKVTDFKRYNRNFRIILKHKEKNNNITFYIFSENEDYKTVLNKDDIFEFKGQFVIYTPTDSRRNNYIFDVILEDGAVVVE